MLTQFFIERYLIKCVTVSGKPRGLDGSVPLVMSILAMVTTCLVVAIGTMGKLAAHLLPTDALTANHEAFSNHNLLAVENFFD